jgi:phage gp36-like protein
VTYAVKQNLIDRFGVTELAQLTDRVDGETIDDTVVARALEDADGLINGYLQSRYALPLASVPATIVAIACNIARYQLFEDHVTEIVRKRYEDAIAWLKDVAAGKVSLGLDGSGDETETESGTVDFDANDRVFNTTTLADY